MVKTWVHLSKTATGDLGIFILTNLKPSTKYDVLIQARTNGGLGPASTAPVCSTLDEGMMGNRRVVKNLTILFIPPPIFKLCSISFQETTTTSTTTTSTTTRVQHTSLSAGMKCFFDLINISLNPFFLSLLRKIKLKLLWHKNI